MTIDKKTVQHLIWGAAGCVLLYWLLHETERLWAFMGDIIGLFMPFIVGAVLAFILNVPMRPIERLLKCIKKPGARRALAVLMTLLAVLVVLAGVIWLLVPQITRTVEQLVAALPDFFQRIYEQAIAFLETNPELENWLRNNTEFDAINWGEWIQKILGLVGGGVTAIMNGVLTAVVELSSGIFNAILSLVFAIYCLSRKEILARQGRRILYAFLPEKASDETIRILRMSNAMFGRFITGQCLEALILGSMFAVSMTIFGMPYMPLVSVIIAVTALVPIVGAFAGCILGAFFILVQDPMLAIWFVVMFLVLQQIEGNLIYPKVVGSSIGLPGMWVLVAVAVGGELMGVVGMLLLIPVAAVLYTLGREITTRRLAIRGIPRWKLNEQPQENSSKRKEKRKKETKVPPQQPEEKAGE